MTLAAPLTPTERLAAAAALFRRSAMADRLAPSPRPASSLANSATSPSGPIQERWPFCATLQRGGSGVLTASAGEIATVIDTSSRFESFRGILLNNAGRMIFYATPTDGALGVFSGRDPERDCLLQLGASHFGSTVVDFALNPVWINDLGQVAIRESWRATSSSSCGRTQSTDAGSDPTTIDLRPTRA